MITNNEIINNQLKRINEKMRTKFSVHYEDDKCCLIIETGVSYMQPPFPLNTDFTMRTEEQMIEYLAGVEDAVNFYTYNGTANGD